MLLRWSPMAVLLGSAAAADVLAACCVLRNRGIGRRALALLLAAAGTWCATYALELMTSPRGVRELWGSLEYVGTTLLPPAWLAFVLAYTGRRARLTRRLAAVLAAEPVIVLTLLAVPATHDLFRHFAPGPLDDVPRVLLGPLYWPHFAWTSTVALLASVLLVVRVLRTTSAFRRQSAVLGVAVVVPLLGNAASSLGLGPARLYDPTPLAASAGALVLVWGAARYHLLDLVPVARDLAFDLLDDPILVVDALGRIVDRNPAAARVLGGAADLGTPLQEVLQRRADVLDATASGPEIRIGDGADAREYEVVTSALADRRAFPAGRLVHLRDITARKAAERHLRFLAENDPLTGLPNRRLLAHRIEQAVARARRSQGRCALLLFDLDRFKGINDTLGHPVGDQVLEQVADRLRAGRRAADTVARLAGDEFAVLLPEVADAAEAALVADRSLAAIARPLRLDGHRLQVTASAGVAMWPDDGADARELLARVDAAMYRAKAAGRNRARHRLHHEGPPAPVVTASSLPPDPPPRPDPRPGPDRPAPGGPRGTARTARAPLDARGLADELRTALDADALDLWFRPVLDLHDGRLRGLRAEVGWRHPRLGPLPPSAVARLAAGAGSIDRLERWLLAQACGQACRWTRGDRPVPVSVALRPRRGPGGPGREQEVARALANTTLPPHLLAVEVPEPEAAADHDALAEQVRRLRGLGVRVALRGFGADRTSLTHLRRLPLDTLMLDGDLVDRAPQEDHGGVVRSVVTLAHLLGMTVVATGVERSEVASALRRIGCDAAEGGYLAAPLAPDAADALAVGAGGERTGPVATEPVTAPAVVP